MAGEQESPDFEFDDTIIRSPLVSKKRFVVFPTDLPYVYLGFIIEYYLGFRAFAQIVTALFQYKILLLLRC